ncbi:hypothetical protein [Arthrobacter sp. 24S4-2]|nr:hypothetical protein [Arthrobacter sp. 24S4-2]
MGEILADGSDPAIGPSTVVFRFQGEKSAAANMQASKSTTCVSG